MLETYKVDQLTDAVDYALDLDVIDPDSIRVILDLRSDQPVALFRLTGRSHLACARVAVTRFGQCHIARPSGIGGRLVRISPTDTKSNVLLKHHLKSLRLPTFWAECENVTRQCAADNINHHGFLLQVVELELIERDRKAGERWLISAPFHGSDDSR